MNSEQKNRYQLKEEIKNKHGEKASQIFEIITQSAKAWLFNYDDNLIKDVIEFSNANMASGDVSIIDLSKTTSVADIQKNLGIDIKRGGGYQRKHFKDTPFTIIKSLDTFLFNNDATFFEPYKEGDRIMQAVLMLTKHAPNGLMIAFDKSISVYKEMSGLVYGRNKNFFTAFFNNVWFSTIIK